MLKPILAVLAIAAFALAAVYVSEGGDVVYYSTLGGFGAMNPFGQTLWSVPASGALIATDPMGSCLAVAYPLSNGTAWLGTQVELYVRGVALWSALLRLNASAIATDCNRIAVGTMDGWIVELQNGQVVSQRKVEQPVISLVYDGGTLRYGVWKPGYIETPLRCGHTVVMYKADRPYLIVDGQQYVGFGQMFTLTPPAAVSENCVLAFAVEGAIHWGQNVISVQEPVYALAISGDGDVLAVGFADKVVVYRGETVVAEIPADMPRSLSLDFRGLTLAVQDDAGVHIYSFVPQTIEVRGCPYGLIRAGAALYNVTGNATIYVPRGASLQPLQVNSTNWVCIPQSFDGRVVQYAMLYRVNVVPPAKGPSLASGQTAYAAPLEASVQSNVGKVKAVLSGWLVNGRRYPPLSTITVDVEGATTVAPLYTLQIQQTAVSNGVKMVVSGVTAYDQNGMPMSPIGNYTYVGLPAYVQVAYTTYYLLHVEAYTNGQYNVTDLWLGQGQTALIYADTLVDFGNGTRLVFIGWSGGVTNATCTVGPGGVTNAMCVVGPGTYIAQYARQYLVTFTAPNYTYSEWVSAGARPSPPQPPALLYDDGRTRIYFNGWQNVPQAVTGPLNVTASVSKEYHITIVYPWGQQEEWVPDGYKLAVDRYRYDLLWIFDHWEPSDVVSGPGVYTAVYKLDLAALAVIASVAAAAIGAVVWLKKK